MPDKQKVLKKVDDLLNNMMKHDGFGEIKIEMKILKRNQKEIIIYHGNQYRYLVSVSSEPGSNT
jgi:hypothetical protein